MARRALIRVVVAGTDITATIMPVLTSLSVANKAGTHSDTASFTVDDTGGQILLPTRGEIVTVALGWSGVGLRQVFTGTVDEVRSSGGRSGGRMLSITARGIDTAAKPKEAQQRHFDGLTIKEILIQAGASAGILKFDVDPALAVISIPYLEMRDESFLNMAERIAHDIGANFRVQDGKAILAQRAGPYTASVRAAWGVNLQSWDIRPAAGRGRFGATRARSYDLNKAAEVVSETATGISDSSAIFSRINLAADAEAATLAAKADAKTSREMSGGGSVVIEGEPDATPDGLCVVAGVRPGVDGTYRVKSVNHSYSRGGGFVTGLELSEPQGGANIDNRLTK